MLKRAPSLTEQAKTHLKDRILNDEFDNGRIPSETDLANELGVSRTTVRDALSRLEVEGAIYRKQGAGTFVNEPGLQIKTRLEEVWSYEDVIKAHDYKPSTKIVGLSTEPAKHTIAKALKIAPHTDIVIIKKLFLADDEPVILAHNRIPAKLLTPPYAEADFCQPIYQFLWSNGRHQLSNYLSEIIPTIASDNLAKILNIPQQTALISFSEIGYNADNEPILSSTSYFRDDLLRFRLIRRNA